MWNQGGEPQTTRRGRKAERKPDQMYTLCFLDRKAQCCSGVLFSQVNLQCRDFPGVHC